MHDSIPEWFPDRVEHQLGIRVVEDFEYRSRWKKSGFVVGFEDVEFEIIDNVWVSRIWEDTDW